MRREAGRAANASAAERRSSQLLGRFVGPVLFAREVAGEGAREAGVAFVVHVEAVGGKRGAQRRSRFGRPGLHHRETRKDGNALGGADFADDRHVLLEAREVLDAEVELRIDEHDRHAPGPRRGDARGQVGAERLGIDAADGVVGADLPDDEVRRIPG